jgi:hypothetical protein
VLQHPRIAAQLAKFGPRKARSRFTWTGIAQQLLLSLETRRGDLLIGVDDQLPQADAPATDEAMWSV